MPLAAVIETVTLDGETGFQVSGEATLDYVGKTVAAAGDINGDGIEDFIVSAVGIDPNGLVSGGAYVVFGTAGGFPLELNLSTLSGTNGFQINGEANSFTGGGSLGGTVSAAGDVNGDGIDDLIVGGPNLAVNGANSGAAWVLFGKDVSIDGDFAANIELSALTGADGFQINGEAVGDQAGAVVSSAGDVNGDGIDDMMVAAYRADPNGSLSGAVYVVFGKDTAVDGDFAANFELSALDGTNGFQINGEATDDYTGFSVAAAGDINGDGIDDLVIGAVGSDDPTDTAGAAYVVFGKSAAFTATFDLGDLDGTNGFRVTGDMAGDFVGVSVAAAGDFNGDGVDDLVLGAHSDESIGSTAGATFVVFGKDTAADGDFAASFALSTLDGTNGVRINGQAGEYSGRSATGAGDVNGDGIDDLIIGAYRASPSGMNSGAAYVVYGRNTAFGATLELADLDGTNGVVINGEDAGDYFGVDVSAADVNGDGLSDLIIGAGYADPGGDSSGAVYIIFGEAAGFTGTPADDSFTGGGTGESLSGLGGKDTLNGLGGDDTIDGGADNDVLSGGDGLDDLLGGAGGDWLQGDAGDDGLDGGDGNDKLFGGTGVDDLIGGLGNDRLDGGSEADDLTGNDGNDLLDGGAGADVMTGGLANDVYIVDDAGDQTIENSGEGYDIVRTSLDGWVLAANIEALELQGSGDIDGTGNGEANNLQGNSGANVLSGLAGVDTINGADGDDTIIGGLGNDLLRGGLGQDTFAVAHAFGAIVETDQIYDFSAAEGDILDLSGAYGGTLAIVGAFTKVAGQMIVSFAGGITTVKLDTTGDGKADYQVKINGDVTGDTGDWVL
ncbi:MAG: hypothetical protein K0R83_1169 [Caulobacter sp.]|jgi:Ca2+-binding RTX toxin-like protein|nr:hypothetical protein [Caulobacter sp.]